MLWVHHAGSSWDGDAEDGARRVCTATDALSRFGHALSDATPTRVLLALRQGPAYPADLAASLGVSRQMMSNHLACLRGCGLVVASPDGRHTRYELADPRVGHDLLELVLIVDPNCCGGETSSLQLNVVAGNVVAQ